MEGTVGEIRIFGGIFAPRGWQFCQGQSLQIAQYDVLFAVLGNIYGGDGSVSFNLPNLCSRIVIGAGQGRGSSYFALGTTLGDETITLTESHMPVHNHQAIVQPGTGSSSAAINLYGVNDSGGDDNPGGDYLGKDTGGGSSSYASNGTLTAMSAGSVKVDSIYAPLPNITLKTNGGSYPHSNIQPVLAVNYIICVDGVFPSRN